MPINDGFEQKKIDPRIYLGILVFRWKLIVICFLYCLLGGVLYLEFSPKQYHSVTRLSIYRDPSTRIESQMHHWSQNQSHVNLLRSESFKARIVERLAPTWLPRLGGNVKELWPNYTVGMESGDALVMTLSIRNSHPAYARAFLREVNRDFQIQREVVKQDSFGSAERVLQEELSRLREQIRSAEDDVIEYQRVNEMEYVQARGSFELGYLNDLVNRSQRLNTEKWMLEQQYPALKGESPEIIRDVMLLTQETGTLAPSGTALGSGGTNEAAAPGAKPLNDWSGAFQEKRFRLARLQRERAELASHMQPDNPKMRSLDEEIAAIRRDMDLQSEIEHARLKQRAAALGMQISALDEAQRRWKNSYLLASRKGADLRHLSMVVARLEAMYSQLYGRLNDLRIEKEIKGEHLAVVVPVRTNPQPVWPDPWKILITVLVAGIGSGLALAMMAYFFDDKVQSISDVESIVGVPFLGGIPYWVHSDLTTRIRPIVSEQHRSGAAEAYRALRTNVLSAVEKAGKKVILITSADSKEGKTLTTLNLAIMMAKTGKRVLLIDMDLRRGVLHKSLECERTPGVIDILRDRRPVSEAVCATPHESLWFVPAGTVEKNTSELLHAADLEALLADVVDKFDFIVMDSAPVLRVTDTVILANCPLVCVIYVAHANKTSKPVIKYSLDMLGDVHVIGLIVNSIEMHRISSLYYAYQYPNYAYYSYAYKYGYNYDLYDEHGRHPVDGRLGKIRRAWKRWMGGGVLPSE
jgi:capsular exopolysaccharide synthesis family protein